MNIFSQILPFGCHGNQSYNKKGMFSRRPLKQHCCKSFIKISAMRLQNICNEKCKCQFSFLPIRQWQL